MATLTDSSPRHLISCGILWQSTSIAKSSIFDEGKSYTKQAHIQEAVKIILVWKVAVAGSPAVSMTSPARLGS